VVYTADGRRLGCLDVVHSGLPVREVQVVQEAVDRLRVRYVPAPGYGPAAGRAMIEEIRAQMGPVEVVLQEVPEVPRGANGKFRMIVCAIPREDRRVVGRDVQGETCRRREPAAVGS
jgi:phenylacetate-CoA ligase